MPPAIVAAINNREALVALESSVLAQGLPAPLNLETARECERAVRREGATPVTIGVVDGVPLLGLSDREMEIFASGRAPDGSRIEKVSLNNLAAQALGGRWGATTVAATMQIACGGGLKVFATGGIGGVHRGVSDTFDISADLGEMALSNVAVVTAGAKAILDLSLTVEKLETLGVPVVGYCTDDFPAFYSRSSGLKCPMRVDRAEDMARLMRAKWALGLSGGIVVANPIPAEYEIAAYEITPLIEKAVAEARAEKIDGREVTPFLLARLARATSGRSLAANIELVKNNALVAARIAKAYMEIA